MTRSAPAPLARDTLVQIAHLVDLSLVGRGWHAQPTVLIHAAAPSGCAPGELHLGVKEVDEHPALALLGGAAPDEWEAIGASQLGWTRPWPVDGLGGPEGAHRHRRRVRVTTLISRSAGDVTVVHHETTDESDVMPSGASGRVPDVLRRCLHLPTPPPEPGVATFFAVVWLGAVRARAAHAARPLGWAEVRAMHPAHRPGRALEVSAGQHAAGIGWGDLRWQTIEGRWAVPSLTPDLAAWFDDGSFARWIQPEERDIAEARAAVTSAAWRRMVQTMRAMGVCW